ncbi:MAG: hypothetical protein J6A03_10820 [Lachnospiraceae bacterium]|nr:hypothetical protein [Lachnospiraceae bacterium]
MLKLQEKLFFSSVVRTVMLVMLIGGNICYHLWIFLRPNVIEDIRKYGYADYFPYQLYMFSILFIVILFIAYDFFRELPDAALKEICQVEKTYWKMDVLQALVLFQWVILTAFIVLSGAIFGFYIEDTIDINIIQYLVKVVLLYVVLNGCIAILLAWCLSRSVGKMIGYICIMLFSCIVSPIFTSGIGYWSMIFRSLYDFSKAFLIMPMGIMYRNEHVLFPVNYSLAARTIFWIVLFLICVLVNYRIRFKRVIMISSVILLSISFAYINRPYSFYEANDSLGENDSITYEQMSYEQNGEMGISENREFEIERYEMDLKVRNGLTAQVKVYLKDTNFDRYPMTLYRQYNVKNVCDEDGNALSYQREGNYITVFNDKGSLKCICLEYEGYLANFYANYNEMFLPGWFAYYPMPGYKSIYEEYAYVGNLFEEKIAFDINVDTNQKIFSDLDEKSKNHFSGKSYGPTLLSGYVSEMTIDHNIRVIYPYLSKMSVPDSNVAKEDFQTTIQYLTDKWGEDEGGVIIITPGLADQCPDCMRDNLLIGSSIWKNYAFNLEKTGELLRSEVNDTDEEIRDNFMSYYLLMKEQEMLSYEDLKREWNSLYEEDVTDDEFKAILVDIIGQEEYDTIVGSGVN